MLALIVLLDQAKEEALLPADPCLFKKAMAIKTSKDMVKEFAKKYISGTTGDLPKVMIGQNAKLRHAQKPLHECAAPCRIAAAPPPSAHVIPERAPPRAGTTFMSTTWCPI